MNTSNPDDSRGLLFRAANGDSASLQQLFAKHRDQLGRMVRTRMHQQLRPRIDPSDVVQDAMTDAAQRLPEFVRHGGEHFYVWLRRIAWERLIQLNRHHVGAQKRSVKREVAMPTALSDESVASLSNIVVAGIRTPISEAMRNEVIGRVRHGLDQLSEADREVLVLRHLEQLSVKQVAEVLQITESATQSRYRRAIERLHLQLGDLH